jgi:arylformamidase
MTEWQQRSTLSHMKKLWDISPPVAPGSPVFPGDTPYGQEWSATLAPGNPVNVSRITLSPHVGAHADAPLHYDAAGAPIGAVDLAPYLGRCRVIHAIGKGPLVQWEHLQHAARELPARVLVRTYERMPADRWDPQLAAYAPEAIERLAGLGVQLVGIDTASIDPAESKTLDSHQVIRRLGLRVLENLVLDDVPEGDYELIALPLKLMAADASPVRAVLREL